MRTATRRRVLQRPTPRVRARTAIPSTERMVVSKRECGARLSPSQQVGARPMRVLAGLLFVLVVGGVVAATSSAVPVEESTSQGTGIHLGAAKVSSEFQWLQGTPARVIFAALGVVALAGAVLGWMNRVVVFASPIDLVACAVPPCAGVFVIGTTDGTAAQVAGTSLMVISGVVAVLGGLVLNRCHWLTGLVAAATRLAASVLLGLLVALAVVAAVGALLSLCEAAFARERSRSKRSEGWLTGLFAGSLSLLVWGLAASLAVNLVGVQRDRS